MTSLDNAYPQHSVARSVVLHLLPGALILGGYLLLAQPSMELGFPPMMALLVAAVLVGVPVELGHLIRLSRRQHGRPWLHDVVLLRERIPTRHYMLIVPAIVIGAFGILALLTPLDGVIGERLFAWLPRWYFLSDVEGYTQYSAEALLVTLSLRLVVDGVGLPLVEELYFRGYLLPRLSRFGWWAPVINHALFTIYHFWQPYNYLTIFLAVLPLGLVVWWKRSVWLGVTIHMTLNLIGGFGAFQLLAR